MSLRSSAGSAMARVKMKCVHSSAAEKIAHEIDKFMSDAEHFEEGEPRPPRETVQVVEGLLAGAEQLSAKIPCAEISTWYGKLDLAWKQDNRLLHLVAYSDGREPLLYFQTNRGEVVTHGETVRPATPEALKSKLDWLVSSAKTA